MKGIGGGRDYPGGHTGSLYNGVNESTKNTHSSTNAPKGCSIFGPGVLFCPKGTKCPEGFSDITPDSDFATICQSDIFNGQGVSSGDSYSGYTSSGYPTGSSHGGYGYSSYDSGNDFMSNVARFNKLNNLDQKALSDLNKPENKDAKWAVDYMCSLYCAGANNPDHQGYYLFSNAHSYALSKSIDTSKSFFAHYMDSLVNQGATNPSHKFYS